MYLQYVEISHSKGLFIFAELFILTL